MLSACHSQGSRQGVCTTTVKDHLSLVLLLLVTPYVLLWAEQPVMLCRVPVTLV